MAEHNGYISTALSGPGGVFAQPPSITLSFPTAYLGTLPGVTITWSTVYGEWASSYRVSAYFRERLLFSQTGEGEGVTSVLSGDVSGYDKLVVEILAWSQPFHRARVESIILGVDKTFQKRDLISFSANLSADPLSGVLPHSEISFSIFNGDGAYNPDNPRGAARYLMERQEVSVRYGYRLGDEVEWIPGGIFYLSDWDLSQNGIEASFSAQNALEYMTDFYEGPETGTLLEIAQAALEQAGLPPMPDGSPRWVLDGSLGAIPIPEQEENQELSKQSVAVVLQYAANAGRCVFYQDRSGKIHIEPLSTALSDYPIDRFNSYGNPQVRLSKQLKAVDINNGAYVLRVSTVGETQPVSNPLISLEEAPETAAWVADYLENRRSLTGSFRLDPRLDPLDLVQVENRFSQTIALVTDVNLEYNGVFKGSYTARGIASAMSYSYYSGDLYAGEV